MVTDGQIEGFARKSKRVCHFDPKCARLSSSSTIRYQTPAEAIPQQIVLICQQDGELPCCGLAHFKLQGGLEHVLRRQGTPGGCFVRVTLESLSGWHNNVQSYPCFLFDMMCCEKIRVVSAEDALARLSSSQ